MHGAGAVALAVAAGAVDLAVVFDVEVVDVDVAAAVVLKWNQLARLRKEVYCAF